ncbi:hypothetical protein, partial [Coleofasciculus sp.]|uniref:hypothetical protein n=1 Tax=Coleofasciculus sp. TaxID=3100458 RepID=UPI004062A517
MLLYSVTRFAGQLVSIDWQQRLGFSVLTAVCSAMRYIVDPPKSPVQKKRSILWLPHAKKAKHPLVSPVQQTRSILWLPPFEG